MKVLVCSIFILTRASWITCSPVFFFYFHDRTPSSCFFCFLLPFVTLLAVENCVIVQGPRRNSSWYDWLVGHLSQGGLENSCLWTLSPKSFTLSHQFCLFSILWMRENFLLFPQKHSPSAVPSLHMEMSVWALGSCIIEWLHLER